jgi:hypothetical protein
MSHALHNKTPDTTFQQFNSMLKITDHQIEWGISNGNTSDLYSGVAQFEPWSGLLSLEVVWCCSVSPRKHQDEETPNKAIITSYHMLFDALVTTIQTYDI